MDKLRTQYELHKRYQKNLNTNQISSSASVKQESTNAVKTNSSSSASVKQESTNTVKTHSSSSASVKQESTNTVKTNSSSSAKTVTETIISGGSGDTEKTSLTSWTSVHVDRSKHERDISGSSYRSLGKVVPNSSLETKPKPEANKGGFVETTTNRNELEPRPRRKTKSLEKHLERNSVSDTSASRKLSCDTSTIDTNTPRVTSQNHGFVPNVPTEAQLRWAQFHRKQRADATEARISDLMKSPLHVCEVEGALDGDGDCNSSSDEHPSQNCKKIYEISSGRRALLRVSARKKEERRQHIQNFGFKMKPDSGNEESEEEQISNHQSSSVDEMLVFEDIAAALQDPHDGDLPNEYEKDNASNDKDTVFSNSKKVKIARKKNSCARRLKGMRSVVQNADEDEQRVKRFEEAYNVLSNVGRESNTLETPLIRSSKRWSRDSSIPVAPSIDGRVYGDLQRSPTFRHETSSKYYGPEVMGAEVNGKKLSDRSASWMMHLPKQDKRKVHFFGQNAPCVDNMNEYPVFMSPQKLKLMEIVSKVHVHEQNSEHFDSSRASKGTFDIERDKDQGAKILFEHESISSSDNNVDDQENVSFTRSEGDYPELGNKIQSMLSGLATKNVIDTDGQSESSDQSGGMEQDRLGSLMLSPRILTKRLNEAITAIATCNWNQVRALIRANHWLAEMADVNDNQYLLHKLAYYGAGTIDFKGSFFSPAPKSLFEEMIQTSNTIVHKVDGHGNLPLHLAAESGNSLMVSCLCKSFPGGASVRNEEGLLPLHLAILSCSNTSVENPLAAVTEILKIFPLALVVTDNNGNLPIHIAAAHLRGVIGAQVVHILLDEAEKQGNSLRISSGRSVMNDLDMNDLTPIEEEFNDPKESMLSVKNGLGWNPLVTAIHRGAGWQVFDAFLSRDGIENIILERDDSGKTILQLTISKEDCDGPSVVSILRAAPNLVMVRDDKTGALPIETACLNGLQPEVITAIVLLDLPIDLDSEVIKYRESFGDSWWYLICDCDDEYADIVDEILELCEYEQKRALCFIKNKASESLISRATPKCRKILRKSLRFAGRYEFVGSADKTGVPKNIKVFEAIDFGTEEDYEDDGRKIILMHYEDREHYIRDTQLLQSIDFSSQLFAEMHFFEATVPGSQGTKSIQRFISCESPTLTLRTIVASMNKKKYRDDRESFERYLTRIQKVFRMVAEALYYLHQKAIVHCNICPESCGKFENGWRLTGLVGSNYSGKSIQTSRMGQNMPPEAIVTSHGTSGKRKYAISSSFVASPSCDIWAFGKLMFEVLIGKGLLPRDISSQEFVNSLGRWNEDNLAHIVSDLEDRGVGTLATDLITHCLCPRPGSRPKSFEEILNHSYWNSGSSIPSSLHRRNRSSMGSVSARKQTGSGIVKRRFQV